MAMMHLKQLIAIFFAAFIMLSCDNSATRNLKDHEALAFQQAKLNGELVNEGLERCISLVDGWLAVADPATGLTPRTVTGDTRDIWNAKDAAADCYPFMVLTAALTNQELFDGKMMDILETETRLTSRVDRLPDTYSFSKKGFDNEEIDMPDILFGSSEYIKDGLLPLTEWLGASPWSIRMIGMLDDMWKHAPVDTRFGKIVSTNVELNGEMLQVLSRVYWMTGDQKYLDWALRLGDYYLLGDQHPTRDFDVLRLRDHGCEVVSGLCELYATVNTALPAKKKAYESPIHEMLDRILVVGRNQDGLFYNQVNPKTGAIVNDGIADNFGYTLNGFYTVYQIDSVESYLEATLKALRTLNGDYRNFDWERGSADGYADAIEGALNLYNREPVTSTQKWINSEMQVMWSMQDSSHRAGTEQWKGKGIIEGWYGDGNFARTTIMYCLWKTLGMSIHPWRSDIQPGAVWMEDQMAISITANENWDGLLKFDTKRHETNMHLPFDWPRINQFPEWFTPEADLNYELMYVETGQNTTYKGEQLMNGIHVELKAGQHRFLLKQTN